MAKVLRKKDQLQVRADLVMFLDGRESSEKRTPSPELWLGLAYQAAY